MRAMASRELICISVRAEQWQAKGLTYLILPALLSIKLAESKHIYKNDIHFADLEFGSLIQEG